MKPVKSLVFIIAPSTNAADLNRIMPGISALSEWLKSELRLIHLTNPRQLDHLVDVIAGYCSDLALLHDSDAYRASGFDVLGLLGRLVIPVLLLPKKFSFSPLAKSILVPLEGQTHISRSLEFALTLAEQTKSHVDIVHVTGHPMKDGQILEAIGDQMHHEVHEELERITAEASPFSTVEERRWVRHLLLCKGCTAEQILEKASDREDQMLVLEWAGSFAYGRAVTIKAVLKDLSCPVFIVRASREPPSRLRTAKDMHINV